MTTATSADRECLRAAGIVLLGGTAVAVQFWAASFPGWPLAAGVVISLLVLGGVLMMTGAPPQPAARWLRPTGLVVALAMAIGGGVLIARSAEAPMLARFAVSRPAFDAVVGTIGPPPTEVGDGWGPFPGACPDQIGSYGISECRTFDGGYLFIQQRGALGNDAGFAYAPLGLPSDDNEDGIDASGFTHLEGPWYGWSCHC